MGQFGGQASDNQIAGIELSAGQLGNGYSFGEYESSSLAGNAFIDNDIDKAFDTGDTPLENVTLRLTGVDFKGNSCLLYTSPSPRD